ncbi:DsbA family oxidoreductase [Bacillus safensis]|uniref:DsbA family oxidoreductase n=1 Tax=Bacillus safensis TaxID=561879 RepID=UPI001CCCE3F8|nr:DsbA family oxidoreductase [Bacillus safensis]MBZ9521535.1 DsbA family oxidoreductase [Bacillus safensis]MCY7509788.1 DsbA family oxidoreductase [Bacillus safensis]MCY7515857.1 DsbA family oxidoreductase [Bacillus safensis]MED4707230.1 DsbA family oxidoreductase [Bacillus safensis]
MKVQIWSDIACPFCYIGKKQLETALEQFPEKDQVEIEFKSFELDPHAPVDVDHDVHDMLVKKYGMSRSQAMAMNEQVKQAGKEKEIDFQFDPLVLTNTFDAHRLAQYAGQMGKGDFVMGELFQAYFTDGKHVGDRQTLLQIAEKAGLDEKEVQQVLGSEAFADHVRKDEQEARQLGINAVPFFLINDKYSVAGAQPADTFLGALETAWKEEAAQAEKTPDNAFEAACADGVCAVPSPKEEA